jgi:hypothetical protein
LVKVPFSISSASSFYASDVLITAIGSNSLHTSLNFGGIMQYGYSIPLLGSTFKLYFDITYYAVSGLKLSRIF